MKNIILLFPLLLIACQPVVLDDTVSINKADWLAMNSDKPYPFTTDSGNIACSMNEVYYFPNDTINNELSNGLPLNKLAQARSKQAEITPNVENAIIPNADLSEAIRIGLDHCQKVQK